MSTTPRTVSDLYPSKWLNHDDLNDRSYTLEIQSVRFDHFYNPQSREKELKAYLVFGNAKKHMILNITQHNALTDIFGSETFTDWHGPITISPGHAPNGKPTLIITAPAATTITIDEPNTKEPSTQQQLVARMKKDEEHHRRQGETEHAIEQANKDLIED